MRIKNKTGGVASIESLNVFDEAANAIVDLTAIVGGTTVPLNFVVDVHNSLDLRDAFDAGDWVAVDDADTELTAAQSLAALETASVPASIEVASHAPAGNATISFEATAPTVVIDLGSITPGETVDYDLTPGDGVSLNFRQTLILTPLAGGTFRLLSGLTINGAASPHPLPSAAYDLVRIPGSWSAQQKPTP